MSEKSGRKIRVGIAGVTGYTGETLLRILQRHPGVEIAGVSSESRAGEKLSRVVPWLPSRLEQNVVHVAELLNRDLDAVFLCLPHGESAAHAAAFVERGVRVVDLSADFRLPDRQVYERWYGVTHPAPDLLGEAVYGLPEFFREKVRGARLVANPGCYPTSVLLPLLPLFREGLVPDDSVIVDSKSGLSGAGKKLRERMHFVEANDNFSPYSPGRTHRHVPEMETYLSQQKGEPVGVTFVPHLVPMDRGILSTIYLRVAGNGVQTVLDVWHSAYGREPFVRVLDDTLPETKWVTGTNLCLLAAREVGGDRVILFSAIDNLVKGASGQAVQNFNLMFGFEEETAL